MNNESFQLPVSLEDVTTLLWDRIHRRYCRLPGPDKTGNDALMVFASPKRARQYLDILARNSAERKTFQQQNRPHRLDVAEWLKSVNKLQREGFTWLILHTPEHRNSEGAVGYVYIAIQDVLDKISETILDQKSRRAGNG